MKLFIALYHFITLLLLPIEWKVTTTIVMIFIYVVPSSILFGKITPYNSFDTPGAIPLYAVSMLIGTFFAIPLWLRRKIWRYFR